MTREEQRIMYGAFFDEMYGIQKEAGIIGQAVKGLGRWAKNPTKQMGTIRKAYTSAGGGLAGLGRVSRTTAGRGAMLGAAGLGAAGLGAAGAGYMAGRR